MSILMVKRFIKNLLNRFNIDIRRIPEYEKNYLLWLRDYNINTIFDIGANVGQFLLKIRKILPSANIYSFEPLKDAYDKLVENTMSFDYVEVFNVALGDCNAKSIINKHDFSAASSLLQVSALSMESYPYIGKSIKEEIIIRRLDDFIIEDHLNLSAELLIKMDVQGFEDKVINGGLETFKKTKIVITEVEFHELYEDQVLFDGIYDQLNRLGFKFKGVINTSLNPHNGMPLFADAVFIRP